MSDTKLASLEEIWRHWKEITKNLPPETAEAVDAYVKRKSKQFPIEKHCANLESTWWLEKELLTGDGQMLLLIKRMLSTAWRLGGGCLLADGIGHVYQRFYNSTPMIQCCIKIDYSLDELVEDAIWAEKVIGSWCASGFEPLMWKVYTYYPREQIISHLNRTLNEEKLTDLAAEEEHKRLWLEGELVLSLLKGHDPDGTKYLKILLSCFGMLSELDMEGLALKLAKENETARAFLLTRPLKELVQLGKINHNCYDEMIDEIIRERQQEAVEELELCSSAKELSDWVKLLYRRVRIKDFSPLPKLLGNKSKVVRTLAEKLLSENQEETHLLIEKQISQLDSKAVLLAKELLLRWEEKCTEGVKKVLFTEQSQMVQYCEQNFMSTMKKKINWLPEKLFQGVHFIDSEEISPEVVLQYLFARYLSLPACERLEVADQITVFLNQQDLQHMMKQVYQFWLSEGSLPKHRMVLLPCAIYGSDALILEMEKCAETLAKEKRGEMAEFIIRAIGLNEGMIALMLLERISESEGLRKPRISFARVETAAREGLLKAANRLGITKDALSDRVIPDLGFDRNGRKLLDYGARRLTIQLTSELSLQVIDEKGKTLKNVPKPRAADDAAKAETAKAEFLDLKKQIKAIQDAQEKRLERALRTGRSWTIEEWKRVFLDNPLMHYFAQRLVWGVYHQGRLLETFRCLEDGEFNTNSDDTYILPETGAISLAHPIELEEDALTLWRQQLEDYEIEPLFSQLDTPAWLKAEDIDSDNMIIRWEEKDTTTSKLRTLAVRYGAKDKMDGWYFMEKGIGGLVFQTKYTEWNYFGPVGLAKAKFVDADGNHCTPEILPKRFVSSVLSMIDHIVVG